MLTADDVTDWGTVDFVADPFIFPDESGTWHMFMEVFNNNSEPQTAIGHAISVDQARTWTYDRIVLDTGTHLSFPYVFEWGGSHYLIPEEGGGQKGSNVALFEAENFPYEWSRRTELVSPDHYVEDHFVFRCEDRWWAIIADWSGGNNLYAYHSDRLETAGWNPHKNNPIVANRPEAARPAGRPIIQESQILLFFQDCRAKYGHKVRAYEVIKLSPNRYSDRERPESPVLEPQGMIGWNSGRMHHIDAWYTGSGWLCAVDGDVSDVTRTLAGDRWSIGMYASSGASNAG